MLEGFTEDTVQILTDEEMEKLARYVKEKIFRWILRV